MGTHLYVCESGGPMKLAIDGSPPKWATCPVCTKSLECTSCAGAQLQGTAPEFPHGQGILYRCPAGHERRIATPLGESQPESAHCPECDGMMMPPATPGDAAQAV